MERQAVPLTKAKSKDHFKVWMYCVGCQKPEVNTESSNRGRSGLVIKEILVIAQNCFISGPKVASLQNSLLVTFFKM